MNFFHNCFYLLFCSANFFASSLVQDSQMTLSDVQHEDVFHLILENIHNLKNRNASNDAAKELIHLIEEGYKIDPINMAKLIEILKYKDASNNAKLVIIKAIEYNSPLTSEHVFSLIHTLIYADASNHATEILLTAIAHGVHFGTKERTLLAVVSKIMNAKKNVEKIRKALHEKQINS